MGNFVFIGIHTSPNTKRMRLSSEGIGKTKVKTLLPPLNSSGHFGGDSDPGGKEGEAERYAMNGVSSLSISDRKKDRPRTNDRPDSLGMGEILSRPKHSQKPDKRGYV